MIDCRMAERIKGAASAVITGDRMSERLPLWLFLGCSQMDDVAKKLSNPWTFPSRDQVGSQKCVRNSSHIFAPR
jgi:hypothetical protein